VVELIDRLTARGHKIQWFDLGGGFGASYLGPDHAKPVTEHARAIVPLLQRKPYRVAVEPGRYISGNSAILLTRVLYRKQGGTKNFVIVDAAMNDLVRPTLYDAYHHIWPVRPRDPADVPPPGTWGRSIEPRAPQVVDVVGPVCETGDYLAQARPLPHIERGDLLAVYTAGAYGFAMSSNYNNRPRAAEVLVDGGTYRVIRRRETLEDLVAPERT
jgi:diaminopimelate decarboxylase